jgi:hypothetical protein
VAFASGIATAVGPSPSADEPCGEIGIVVLPLLFVGGLVVLLALGIAVLVLAVGLTGPALSCLRWVARRSRAGVAEGVRLPPASEPQGVAWLLRD